MPPPDVPRSADPDYDDQVHSLVDDITALPHLPRHILLCTLLYAHRYRQLGSRRLHAAADSLTERACERIAVIEFLRFLAELDCVVVKGADRAALAIDRREHSETARLFGEPIAVLRAAAMMCLRQHWLGNPGA